MYLIAKQQRGYQAIPIKDGDKWDFHKVLPGKQEVRIVLRVRGHRYLLYSTRTLSAKYPALGRAQLTALCDEIIAITAECITNRQAYIEFDRIAGGTVCRHKRRWYDSGLITPDSLEDYLGHPVDPKTEQLVSHVRVDHRDIIVINHEPPTDCEQEELPY